MNRSEAKRMARDLRERGLRWHDIADKLKEAGFVSQRGTPLSFGGAQSLIYKRPKTARKSAPPPVRASKKAKNGLAELLAHITAFDCDSQLKIKAIRGLFDDT